MGITYPYSQLTLVETRSLFSGFARPNKGEVKWPSRDVISAGTGGSGCGMIIRRRSLLESE